jgi:serine protease Do
VVGITQIFRAHAGLPGASFAIPIDVALKVKSQIVATGTRTAGSVTVQDLTSRSPIPSA